MKHPQHNTPSAPLTTLSDVMHWREALRELHARLASHFARPEPYARVLRFVEGILSSVERKNGWQLAEQAREATPYGMQRLLSEAVWDTDGVRDEIRAFALQQLGSRHVIAAITLLLDGVLIEKSLPDSSIYHEVLTPLLYRKASTSDRLKEDEKCPRMKSGSMK